MRRVVLDSNIFISAFATPRGVAGRLIDYFEEYLFDIILSQYILAEVGRVLRDKLRLNESFIARHLHEFATSSKIVDPLPVEEATIDPNDYPILGTALAGDADALVTDDHKLLALKVYRGIPIITPREFFIELRRVRYRHSS